MKVIAVESRSYLKERTIKYCIVIAFISIWLLVQVIYYSRGQFTMSHLRSSLFQFLISANLITLTLLLVAGLLQAISMKRKVTYKCNSIMAELTVLCLITCFQTVAAIALSAGIPSFPCSQNGTCREIIFFDIVAWILPLLLSIHTIELTIRARRAATTDSSVWTMAAWTVDWEGALSNFNDINTVEKVIDTRTLVLPQTHARKASQAPHSKMVRRNTQRKSMMLPKTPSSEQCILIIPSKVQCVVPRIGPPPKYFIQIPENIQYTVPRISAAPCPKQRARGQGRKWSHYLKNLMDVLTLLFVPLD